MIYEFGIKSRVKPYVRMTQRGKYVKPQAIEYISSQEALKVALKNQMIEHGWKMLPGQTPLEISILIQPANHRHDLDNIIKALLDGMSGVVFPDDRWVDIISATRCPGRALVDIQVKMIEEV